LKVIGNAKQIRGLDNIRMDLREIWWEDVDWMLLAQDRDQWRARMNIIMNLRVPGKVGNFNKDSAPWN